MSVANHLLNSEEKYKSSSTCQNYVKNLNAVKKFESLNEQITANLSKIEKASAKRNNSMINRKISDISDPQYGLFHNGHASSCGSNIVINNFNGNYFDMLSSGKMNVNANANNVNFNDAAKKIIYNMYNINVGNSLLNSININNYNFNLPHFTIADGNSSK